MMMSALLSLVLLFNLVPSSASGISALAPDDKRFARLFTEPVGAVRVENPDGPVELQTWPASYVGIVASYSAEPAKERLESLVSFKQSDASVLRVSVAKRDCACPISLMVYVPASLSVAIKGGSGKISVKGSLAALSVESISGAIAIHLPEQADADISARTLEGTITSKVSLTRFGTENHRALDAQVGEGGSPAIIRAARSSIEFLPDSPSRLSGLADAEQVLGIQIAGNKGDAVDGEILSRVGNGFRSGANANEIPVERASYSSRPGEDVIKLESRLVSLNVKVADAAGKTLPNLKKEDFVVAEDGVFQVITHFEPVTAPLHIALLLDLSGSTSDKMKTMKRAAKQFIDALKPNDQVAIAGFTRRFFIISNFTTDKKLLKERIDDMKNRHSGTAFYDAMWATLDLFDEAAATRKAVVVLTDGVDNSLDHPDDRDYIPKHPFDELMSRLAEADATVYPIYLDTEYEVLGRHGRGGHDAYAEARKQLNEMADQTGATLFRADRIEDLEGVYHRVAMELHSLYSIAYYPVSSARDGKWKKITVGVSREGVKARTKRGYFAR
ncbi:MAG TPA: VWA domain-containing protein [Blastocatellia bacterium]